LNFVLLTLFLFSTVSSVKLQVTKDSITTPVMVTFNGYIRLNSTKALIKDDFSFDVIFKAENGQVYKGKVLGDGKYSVTLPIGRYVRTVISKNYKFNTQKVCVRTSSDVSQDKNTAYLTLLPPPPVVVPKPVVKPDGTIVKPVGPQVVPPPTTFKIRGYVKSSLDNKPLDDKLLKNATMTFTNKASGNVYSGTFLKGAIWSVVLPAGSFARKITVSGYAPMTAHVVVTQDSDEKNHSNDIFVMPDINGYRATLTWGSTPLDLDAHVILPDGTEVNFDSRKSKDGKVTLDVDALKGYGPESVSFLNGAAKGVYQFYVNRYTNDASLIGSGAKVVVIKGSKVVKYYNVPTTGDKTADNWLVFSLDLANDKLTDIDQIVPSS